MNCIGRCLVAEAFGQAEKSFLLSFVFRAPGNYERDVIMLLVRAEAMHFFKDRVEHLPRLLAAMPPQAFN